MRGLPIAKEQRHADQIINLSIQLPRPPVDAFGDKAKLLVKPYSRPVRGVDIQFHALQADLACSLQRCKCQPLADALAG